MKTRAILFLLSTGFLLAAAPRVAAGEEDGLAPTRDKLRHVLEKIDYHRAQNLPVPPELLEAAEHLKLEIARAQRETDLARHQRHEQAVEKALHFLDDVHAEQARDLRRLRDREPDAFVRAVEDLLPWVEHMHMLRKEDPEMFELELHSHRLEYACDRLAEQVRRSEGDERATLEQELRSRLRELFDTRLDARRRQVERVERELRHLREKLEQMTEDKEGMIERRMRAMVSGNEEW